MDVTTIRRLHEALNRARNEQQKFILLAYAAQQQPPTSPPPRERVPHKDLLNQCYQSGITTLATDLELALTFADFALRSSNESQTRSRYQKNARHAFDSIVRIRKRLELPEEFARWLDDKLTLLKTALEELREQL
jgi:hypothetical protein